MKKITNVSKRFINFVLKFLQFVQIRNSSSFMQQSANFIPKRLLQNKPDRKRNC